MFFPDLKTSSKQSTSSTRPFPQTEILELFRALTRADS